MVRIQGNTFFMEARLSTRKKKYFSTVNYSYACKFGKYVAEKKEQEKEGQWMGMPLLLYQTIVK